MCRTDVKSLRQKLDYVIGIRYASMQVINDRAFVFVDTNGKGEYGWLSTAG